MTIVAFDPGARLRLAFTPTGADVLVEAVLRDADGELELGLVDEDGNVIGTLTLRQAFLDELIATGHPLASPGAEAAA